MMQDAPVARHVHHLSETPASTEHLERVSGTESGDSIGIEEMENLGLEEKMGPVLMGT